MHVTIMQKTNFTLVSKDVEILTNNIMFCYYTSFDLHDKVVQGCPPTQTPKQKFKSEFWIFSSHGMGSSLVSLKIIFEALRFSASNFIVQSLDMTQHTKFSSRS